MKRVRAAGPSPTIVVAAVALVAALAGTAIAGPTATTSVSKKQTKKIAKKEATRYFDANIGGATVGSAASAANASQLGGQSASAFQTASASDLRTSPVELNPGNQTVLSKGITIPSTKTVTAVASIEATGDDGVENRINCNLSIAGTDGARQSTLLADGTSIDPVGTLPLTQSRTLGAGTHTVLAECNEAGVADTEIEDRSLSVVATG